VRFTRRELRSHTGLSDTPLRVHLDRLLSLEYVVPHAGRNGQRFSYELVFDGDVARDAPQAIGLIDAQSLRCVGTTTNLASRNADLAGCLLAPGSQLASALLVPETSLSASAGAVLSSLAAAVAVNALLEEPREPRRSNGASYLTDRASAP
jgi:hypothetical protein